MLTNRRLMLASSMMMSSRRLAATTATKASSSSSSSASAVTPLFSDGLADNLTLLRDAKGRGEVTLTKGIPGYESVAVINFDNSVCKNAFSTKMMVEFYEAVEELRHWEEGRAVVITGSSNTFCSGADLGNSKEFFTSRYGKAMNQVMTIATHNLKALAMLSVAAVDGFAVGGGAELITSTDYRVFSSRARVQYVHASRGVVPGWGGVSRLNDIVGRNKTLHLLQGGSEVSANSALSLHLCDAIVEAKEGSDFLNQVLSEFLQPIIDSSKSNNVLRNIKSAVFDTRSSINNIINSSSSSSSNTDIDIYSRYLPESTIFRSLWGGEAQMTFMKQWESAKKSAKSTKSSTSTSTSQALTPPSAVPPVTPLSNTVKPSKPSKSFKSSSFSLSDSIEAEERGSALSNLHTLLTSPVSASYSANNDNDNYSNISSNIRKRNEGTSSTSSGYERSPSQLSVDRIDRALINEPSILQSIYKEHDDQYYQYNSYIKNAKSSDDDDEDDMDNDDIIMSRDFNNLPQSFSSPRKQSKKSVSVSSDALDREIIMEENEKSIFGEDNNDSHKIDQQFLNKVQRKAQSTSNSNMSSRISSGRNSRGNIGDDFNIFNSKPVHGHEDLDVEDANGGFTDPSESHANIMKQLRKNMYDRYNKSESDDKVDK